MSLAQTPLKELLSQRRVRGLLAAAGHSGAGERSARGLRAWGELSPVGSLFSKPWPRGAWCVCFAGCVGHFWALTCLPAVRCAVRHGCSKLPCWAWPSDCALHAPASSAVCCRAAAAVQGDCPRAAANAATEEVTADVRENQGVPGVDLWSLLTIGNKELEIGSNFFFKETTFLENSHSNTWKMWIGVMFTPSFTMFSSCLQTIRGLHKNTFRSFQLKIHHRLNIIVI